MPTLATRADREAAKRPSLLECHGALSALVFAIRETLSPMWCSLTVKWVEGPDLHVAVEVRQRDKQAVMDRLLQGALYDVYDYRFTISHDPSPAQPDDWVVVTAYPQMSYDHDRVKAAREKVAA